MYKKIQSIHTAPETMMGAIKIRQAFPLRGIEQVSPFILLHHFDFTYLPHENNFNVPPHPHRGFSPVTFLFEGSIEHEDSIGNKHVVYNDEVQWINAGRGIIHSEKADKAFVEKGGRSQGIQLWINTPKAEKMNPPTYQPITKNEIVLIEKEGVEFRLISGKYEGKKGPAKSEVVTAMLRMKTNSEFSLHFPADHNVTFYVLEGELSLNTNQTIKQHDLVVFEQSADEILLNAKADSKLLIMSGMPINEPMVTHGPFVMNSETEILEAMRDYQQGKMGFLY
ncbi:MAG: pirin family protein [Sphingobacteriaceae bacterium]|nr:pirin family protein [Sphingobacteriaceae bacterium]